MPAGEPHLLSDLVPFQNTSLLHECYSVFTFHLLKKKKKKFSAEYTESLVKETCVVGFHTFLMGMYGCERTASCMVQSD